MKLIFVHGWSVTNTNTYRDLPESIALASADASLDIDIAHVYLGKYVSFHDEVSMDDIARALQQALLDQVFTDTGKIGAFSCITHSTGGPVVRYWANKYYGQAALNDIPLQHLVMLAPANHGSGLAALGQKRVSRIKSWFAGVEPGQRVLDWLRLGSRGSWQLNEQALAFDYGAKNCYPFVIAGQGIDTKAYDFINSYLVESGSDGVVRVAAANLNCQFIRLEQQPSESGKKATLLPVPVAGQTVNKPVSTAIAVLHDASHAGGKMGVLNSRKNTAVHQRVVSLVLQALAVRSSAQYQGVLQQWQGLSEQEQALQPVGKRKPIDRYVMLVFRVRDSSGAVLRTDDYDVLMLAGKNYSPDSLPEGFFVDRQANHSNGTLVYYVSAEKMLGIKDGLFGIRIVARPERGFSYYRQGEYRAKPENLATIFNPNETTYIDIVLERQVDKNVFRFDGAGGKQGSFKNVKPSGDVI